MHDLLDAPAGESAPPAPDSPNPGSDDASLLRRSSRRDFRAFEDLVRRHQGGLRRFLEGLLGNREDAEDVAQEALLAAFRTAGEFQARASVRSWLYAIGKNTARAFQRSSGRRRRRDRGRRPRGDAATDPSESWAFDLLARIPEPFREVLLLCDVAGFTYEEAADTLGCPVKTVSTRLFRGRERMAALLAERDLGHGPRGG